MSTRTRMVEIIDQFSVAVGLVAPAGGAPGDIVTRWERLRSAGVDRPGQAFGEWLDLGVVGGVVPPLLANCRNVDALLVALARFHPLWGDDEVRLESDRSGWVRATLRSATGDDVHPDTLDAFLVALTRMVGRLTNPPLAPARLGELVEFSPTDLAAPIAFADPAISAMLAGYAETEVARRGAGWERRVRAEIRADAGSTPTLGVVAASLAVSPRTLQQRLLESGTKFENLLDDERRLLAIALLANPAFPVTEAARRCGYGSLEGFSRAVRRWTGCSPTEWRSMLRNP